MKSFLLAGFVFLVASALSVPFSSSSLLLNSFGECKNPNCLKYCNEQVGPHPNCWSWCGCFELDANPKVKEAVQLAEKIVQNAIGYKEEFQDLNQISFGKCKNPDCLEYCRSQPGPHPNCWNWCNC